MNEIRTQNEAIREHLMTYGWIDKPTALKICGADRLGARIYELRNDKESPMRIRTEHKTYRSVFGNSKTVAVYRYDKEEREDIE